MPPTRLFIVDDHSCVRDGLRLYLQGVEDLHIVGEAGTVADAVAGIERAEPDVVVLDVELPDGEGIEVARRLRATGASARFVVFTTYRSQEVLLEARMAGALAVLFKDASRSELLATVRAVAQGESLISPTLLDEVRTAQDGTLLDELLPHFTAQERRIVRLIAEGATNREIGERLDVTEKTTRNYVSAILAKLGFRNRTEVAVYVTRRLAMRSQRRVPNSPRQRLHAAVAG